MPSMLDHIAESKRLQRIGFNHHNDEKSAQREHLRRSDNMLQHVFQQQQFVLQQQVLLDFHFMLAFFSIP